MNNIKSFNEFTGHELEQMVYEQELNEGSIMGGGIRGFFNKRAAGKVKAELAEEIEMSKSIMEGIKQGLDSLNSDFDVLRKKFDDKEGEKSENQKTLDSIMKIIEDSRKNTWDLNELIDEGEIDYTGFTANVGIASVAYFGILLTPFRSVVMIHKGYNYFFNIVKNTIRKALVMLQLNFDQFENLIITKGFQSLDYLQDQDTSIKVSEFYGKLYDKLFDPKIGMMKGKRGSEIAKQQMQFAKNQIDAMMKADKSRKLSDNAYNCLDQYNNTYTKSLETLRQYTQDDVQKNLDAIKASMTKLAGQEVDLQTFAELIIAAAEEHAYKVSSSIYNKFAKMTEVFSLPNQKKLIDLIQASTKEQMDAAEKEADEKKDKMDKEKVDEINKEGAEIFEKIGGKVGELDGPKYNDSEINVSGCKYEKYKELDDEEKEKLNCWLTSHQEVLNKLDKDMLVIFNVPFNEVCQDYIDSLIDYIGVNIGESSTTSESYILNFDEYIFEKKESIDWDSIKKSKDFLDKVQNTKLSKKELNNIIDILQKKIVSTSKDKKTKWKDVLGFVKERRDRLNKEDKEKKSKGTSKINYLNFKDFNDHQMSRIKELYIDNEDIAKRAFRVIGEYIKDNSFIESRENIIKIIKDCYSSKKEKLSSTTYNILLRVIKTLKDKRSHDYYDGDEQTKKE